MKQRPSILQDKKECFFSGRTDNLHLHHIYGGFGRRRVCDKYGFWVYLTGELHNQSFLGVHCGNANLDQYLKKVCQTQFEQNGHSHQEFVSIVGRSYL